MPTLWPEFAASGCVFVVSAFESVDDAVLERLDKGHTAADAARAVAILRDAGIEVRPSWLPFTPWTTRDDLVALLDFVHEHDLVGSIDPVQYSVRLLLPEGSLLLDHPDLDARSSARGTPSARPTPGRHPIPRSTPSSSRSRPSSTAPTMCSSSTARSVRQWAPRRSTSRTSRPAAPASPRAGSAAPNPPTSSSRGSARRGTRPRPAASARAITSASAPASASASTTDQTALHALGKSVTPHSYRRRMAASVVYLRMSPCTPRCAQAPSRRERGFAQHLRGASAGRGRRS